MPKRRRFTENPPFTIYGRSIGFARIRPSTWFWIVELKCDCSWRTFVPDNGTVLSGLYDGKIVGIRFSKKNDIPPKTKVVLELIGVGQRLTSYIPPGDRGYLARKSILYFSDCPPDNNGNRDYRQLRNRYIGVEIESFEHPDGQSYIRVIRFCFSQFSFFPPDEPPDPKKRSWN